MRTRDKYQKYNDAGHGWLRVKKEELVRLGIEFHISAFSYMQGKYAYLEEDQDASLFYFMKQKFKETFEVAQNYVINGVSKIRRYSIYIPRTFSTPRKKLELWWTKEGGVALVCVEGFHAGITGREGVHLYEHRYRQESEVGTDEGRWQAFAREDGWILRVGKDGLWYRNDLDLWNLVCRPASKETIRFPDPQLLKEELESERMKEQKKLVEKMSEEFSRILFV